MLCRDPGLRLGDRGTERLRSELRRLSLGEMLRLRLQASDAWRFSRPVFSLPEDRLLAGESLVGEGDRFRLGEGVLRRLPFRSLEDDAGLLRRLLDEKDDDRLDRLDDRLDELLLDDELSRRLLLLLLLLPRLLEEDDEEE